MTVAPCESESRRAVTAALSLAGLVLYIYLIGWLVSLVRYAAARLPADVVTPMLSNKELFVLGLRSTALTAVAFAVLAVVAYFVSGFNWGTRRQDWEDVVMSHGVRKAISRRESGQTPAVPGAGERAPDSWALRMVAGFNMIVVSAVAGLVAARVVEKIWPQAWLGILIAGLLVGIGVAFLLARWGPLQWGHWGHVVGWVVVGVVVITVAAPLGLLLIATVAVATVGRRLVRRDIERSFSGLLRSPLPWALLSVYGLAALAYWATPPVAFPRATVQTTAGERVGGYLLRTSDGVYLATCDPRANGTSTNERVGLVRASTITATTVGGEDVTLDSGERPSLLRLAFSALGIDAHPPTLITSELRASRAACANVAQPHLTVGAEDAALGVGAIDGPPPPGGQAVDGEPPITAGQTPPAVAKLALRYQPTVEVTVADRFWPVSVGAVLHDLGYYGANRTCLMIAAARKCRVITSLRQFDPGIGNASDYLWYPARLSGDPTDQFQAFETGQGIAPGTPDRWFADPGLLNPWQTAQIYVYYAGPITLKQWRKILHTPTPAGGLIGLEYWFFYPFNYYPTKVNAEVMNEEPLHGDEANTDLHQGDWEHVTVLLEPGTLTPRYLYMARHNGEGQFYAWDDPALLFDNGHPVVQAAFGGHPSYDNGCGARPRSITGYALSDWVVCGTGRFAFRAATTPLVDVAHTTWACWKGHFGEAAPGFETVTNESDLGQQLRTKVFDVAGPGTPLRQGETPNACAANDPGAPERTAAANGITLANPALSAISPQGSG